VEELKRSFKPQMPQKSFLNLASLQLAVVPMLFVEYRASGERRKVMDNIFTRAM
jgi:hypothetical protein